VIFLFLFINKNNVRGVTEIYEGSGEELYRRSLDSSVLIQEGNFIVKNLIHEDEKIQAHCLRHRVFCQELGWVKSENLLEIDDYDRNAIFFGVFNENSRLLAFLRLILPDDSFMLEREFALLIDTKYLLRKEMDTAEVSRLCVAEEARNERLVSNSGIHDISMFLYKGVYHWCIKNDIRYLYLVAEYKIYRLLRAKGFPCRLIGQPVTMSDGVLAVAAIMDWREFEALNTAKKPEMMKWFSQYQSAPVPWQSPGPALCLQHSASV